MARVAAVSSEEMFCGQQKKRQGREGSRKAHWAKEGPPKDLTEAKDVVRDKDVPLLFLIRTPHQVRGLSSTPVRPVTP